MGKNDRKSTFYEYRRVDLRTTKLKLVKNITFMKISTPKVQSSSVEPTED